MNEAKIYQYMQLSYQYTETMVDLKKPLSGGLSFADVFNSVLNPPQDDFKIEPEPPPNEFEYGTGAKEAQKAPEEFEKYETNEKPEETFNEINRPEDAGPSAGETEEKLKTSLKEETEPEPFQVNGPESSESSETSESLSESENLKKADADKEKALSEEEIDALKEILHKLRKIFPDLEKFLEAAAEKDGIKEIKIKISELKVKIVEVDLKDEEKPSLQLKEDIKALIEEFKNIIALTQVSLKETAEEGGKATARFEDFKQSALELFNSLKLLLEEASEKEKEGFKKADFKSKAETEEVFKFETKESLNNTVKEEVKDLGVYYKISQVRLKKFNELKETQKAQNDLKESLKLDEQGSEKEIKPLNLKKEFKNEFSGLKDFKFEKPEEESTEHKEKEIKIPIREFTKGSENRAADFLKTDARLTEVKTDRPSETAAFESLKVKADAAKDFAALKTNLSPRGNEIINNVIKQIDVMVKADKTEATIRLKPDHLGDMKIKLSLEDGKMFLRFTVTNQAVKEVIETNLQQLKDSLQEMGFSLGNFSVDVGSGEAEKEGAAGGKGKKSGAKQVLNYDEKEEERFEKIKISNYEYVA